MIARRPLIVVFALALAAAACEPTADDDDAVDDDDAGEDHPDTLEFDLPGDAVLGQDYLAQIRVPGFGGSVTFFQTGGLLPEGMRVTANGVLQGAPTEYGAFTFTVTATDMSIPDIVDEASFTVLLPDRPLHLGVVHDRPTTLTEERDQQREPWMRIQAEGDPAMTEITLDVARFHPGANDEPEGGWGDDIRLEEVDLDACTVTPGKWVYPDNTECDPEQVPTHCNEDDPLQYAGDGRFVAGADTGHLEVNLSCGELGVIDFRVQAVPPGWCPLGEHYGGPPWQTPGACEP